MTISIAMAAKLRSRPENDGRSLAVLKNIILWILAFAVALVSGLSAMGAIAKDQAPDLAVTLQPLNGFGSEKLASTAAKASIAANQGQFPDSVDPVAVSLAKQAFLSEPVTPEAVAVLALGVADGIKRKLMYEAFTLSRRQQLATSWMIVDSGVREDIPAILNYYDTMLRTSGSASAVIIPVMARALADKNFIEPFAGLLSKNPPWSSRFWQAVVTTPEAIGNAATLRKLLYAPNGTEEDYRDANLIRALVNDKQLEAAEDLYQLLAITTKQGSLIKNGSFIYESNYPPLDWQLASTGEYGAAITHDSLQLSAIRSSGGVFARQLVKLPPKVLTMEVKSDSDIPEDANMFISISCAETIQSLPKPIRVPLTDKVTSQQISNVQSDCGFFWFDITARAAENGNGFDVSLNSVSLKLE